MFDKHAFLLVLVCAAVTFVLRAAPFFIFGEGRETPPFVLYLGKVLPYAIIAMLVVYCVKDISFTAVANFLPYIISGGLVILLHVWKRNTLLSIVAGTLSYMALVQYVF